MDKLRSVYERIGDNMKECKRCGAIMIDDRKDNKCEKCKQKTKKIINIVAPVAAVATTVVMYTLCKGKIGGIPAKQISDVTNDVVSGLADNSEKVFGGLAQSTLDSLAKDTYRGVKAVVQGDTLEYIYKTASGKGVISALFKLDDAGELVGYLGNGPRFAANSPRFFCEKILEKIQEIK